ncbi:MAG: hypothetical protein ACF8OB_11405, partial [Phycisphaeraceae bacterium JB051]
CSMYDPQEDKRYDADNGTALGEKPEFKDLTDEQKAQIQKMQEELLAKIQSQQQGSKAGCGSTTAILLIAVSILTGSLVYLSSL